MTDRIRRKPPPTAGWPRTPSQHRRCVRCGDAFTAYLIRRRYCGTACRQAAWRERHR